jgi:hypothetical protein
MVEKEYALTPQGATWTLGQVPDPTLFQVSGSILRRH